MEVAFEDYWPAVRGQAMRLVHDEALADDLAQEAFVRLWIAAREDHWPEVPRAWLSVVVRNLATSGFRRTAVARRGADNLGRLRAGLDLGRAVENADFRADIQEALTVALARLPADRRRAILLAGSGYSATEIGRELGRTTEATRTLLCRSRQAIRSELAPILGCPPN